MSGDDAVDESLLHRVRLLHRAAYDRPVAPFAEIVELWRADLAAAEALEPEARRDYGRLAAQGLVFEAMRRREPRDVVASRWRDALACGFHGDRQRSVFACSVAAHCVRKGWADLGLRALDDLGRVASEQPEPLRQNVVALRAALVSARDGSGPPAQDVWLTATTAEHGQLVVLVHPLPLHQPRATWRSLGTMLAQALCTRLVMWFRGEPSPSTPSTTSVRVSFDP